ncbi:MAG TPA: polysaccharide biosynthesis C-terminal domain-containing protein, partial [Anaeromyxobacter sp.]|nr:polysaccharide biosynthesis C-terminal domain-containing protein [Anaeromyxobacter sp.]
MRLLVTAGAPLAGALTGVIRNKWIALHLDAAGVGILAQVSSAQTWIGTLSGLGLGLPVARAVGEATGRGDDAAARRAVWSAASVASLAALSAASLGLAFAGALSTALLGSPEHAGLVRISMIGVVGIALQNTLQGFFSGRSDAGGPLAFAVAGGGTAMLLAFALVPRWGLTGAALAAAVLYPAGLLGAALARRRVHAEVVRPAPRPVLDRREAGTLVRLGAATLLLALFDL